jgi:hypothetical protein
MNQFDGPANLHIFNLLQGSFWSQDRFAAGVTNSVDLIAPIEKAMPHLLN